MKKAAKAPAEKSARAKFPTAHLKPQELVAETIKKSDAIKAHPSYANTPEAQQVATSMASSAQALDDIQGETAPRTGGARSSTRVSRSMPRSGSCPASTSVCGSP